MKTMTHGWAASALMLTALHCGSDSSPSRTPNEPAPPATFDTTAFPFEPLGPVAYTSKVKMLPTGRAVTEEEAAAVENEPETLRGSNVVRSAELSFPLTALALVREGRPFTEVLTTDRFMLNPPLMSLLAYGDNVVRSECHSAATTTLIRIWRSKPNKPKPA